MRQAIPCGKAQQAGRGIEGGYSLGNLLGGPIRACNEDEIFPGGIEGAQDLDRDETRRGAFNRG